MSGNIIPPIQYDLTGDDQDLVMAINSQKVAQIAKKVFIKKTLNHPPGVIFFLTGLLKNRNSQKSEKIAKNHIPGVILLQAASGAPKE